MAKALEHYNQALKLTREIGDKLGETETLYGLARTQSKAGKTQDARKVSILINFKLGVEKTGTFRFYIVVEALP